MKFRILFLLVLLVIVSRLFAAQLSASPEALRRDDHPTPLQSLVAEDGLKAQESEVVATAKERPPGVKKTPEQVATAISAWTAVIGLAGLWLARELAGIGKWLIGIMKSLGDEGGLYPLWRYALTGKKPETKI